MYTLNLVRSFFKFVGDGRTVRFRENVTLRNGQRQLICCFFVVWWVSASLRFCNFHFITWIFGVYQGKGESLWVSLYGHIVKGPFGSISA